MHEGLLAAIAIAIVGATFLAILTHKVGQPLLLAYLAAGIALGPELGFGWIAEDSVNAIAEIGLVLLLYIIGLEIDVKKILASGKTLLVSGVAQFILTLALGVPFFAWVGFPLGGGRFDTLYLAVAAGLSSTMIVVKVLYDKRELSTLSGRITLGILVFQDLWAIAFLSLQPNLLNPHIGELAFSFVKGATLVACSLLISRYVLVRVFASIARTPELLLITAVAWCFFVSGAAGHMHLSLEMGALVAGVSLSAFPYNTDVIAKVINIRDFFITLFFVGLGLQIPMPTASMLGYAALLSLFIVASRFVTITPILYAMRNGLRASILPAINLAQLSEFSLVIAALGLHMGHIDDDLMGIFIFSFAFTSVGSTYAMQYSHQLQERLTVLLRRLGLNDLNDHADDDGHGKAHNDIVFLGFYREASSIFHELGEIHSKDGGTLADKVRVIDFNPQVRAELVNRGVPCSYGDISSNDTLHHSHIEDSRVVVCSISDPYLKGTNNSRLLRAVERICPKARILVTSDTLNGAASLYEAGAYFVFVPRVHSAMEAARAVAVALADEDDASVLRDSEMARLAARNEVVA